MPNVPPIVQSATVGGSAYLIAWERLTDGSWGAHIAWVELEGEAWKVKSARVTSEDVRRIDGYDYTTVPRREA